MIKWLWMQLNSSFKKPLQLPNLRHWGEKKKKKAALYFNTPFKMKNTKLLYMISVANTVTLWENFDQPIKLVSEA